MTTNRRRLLPADQTDVVSFPGFPPRPPAAGLCRDGQIANLERS